MANVTKDVADKVRLGLELSHGPAVTVDGVELIPVSLVGFGFGGGEGGENGAPADDEDPEGGFGRGGGGGGMSIPIGAYLGGPDGLRFRPNPIALLVVAVPVIWVAGHALARILKAAR